MYLLTYKRIRTEKRDVDKRWKSGQSRLRTRKSALIREMSHPIGDLDNWLHTRQSSNVASWNSIAVASVNLGKKDKGEHLL